MSKAEDFLVQRRVSSDLLDEIENLADPKLPTGLKAKLEATISTSADLKALREDAKGLSAHIEQGLMDEFRHETETIQDDIRWAKTPEGRVRLMVNDWFNPLVPEFRGNMNFEDVMVGSHAKRNDVIYVVGSVATQQDLTALKNFLESAVPPLPLLVEVTVSGASV